jgi:hypothetical protein
MASDIFWLVVTATLLSLVTYCLFNPPRNRIRPVEQEPDALHRAHQARPGASKLTSKTTDIA